MRRLFLPFNVLHTRSRPDRVFWNRTGSEPKIRFTGPDRITDFFKLLCIKPAWIITRLHKNQPCLWNFYSPVSISWQKFICNVYENLVYWCIFSRNHKNKVMNSLEYKVYCFVVVESKIFQCKVENLKENEKILASPSPLWGSRVPATFFSIFLIFNFALKDFCS